MRSGAEIPSIASPFRSTICAARASSSRASRTPGGRLEHTVPVIPVVHQPGGVVKILGDPLGLPCARRARNHARQVQECRCQLPLGVLGKVGEIHACPGDRCGIDTTHPEDAAHAGVRHLDVVDRVLLRL